MGYYVDLESISIDQYKEILKTTELIPSWKALEKDIDKNLDIIKKQHIENLDGLLAVLKGKDKIKDFSCIPEAVSNKLEKMGIKNTLKLYDEILTRQNGS